MAKYRKLSNITFRELIANINRLTEEQKDQKVLINFLGENPGRLKDAVPVLTIFVDTQFSNPILTVVKKDKDDDSQATSTTE